MSPHTSAEPVTSNDAASSLPAAVISQDHLAPPVPGPLTDQPLWARVVRHARCADGRLDPDEWFPISVEAGMARQQAAAAIAVCTACLVRRQCLALSLRHWDIGQHGVWGGLIAADRAQLRAQLLADAGMRALLPDGEYSAQTAIGRRQALDDALTAAQPILEGPAGAQ